MASNILEDDGAVYYREKAWHGLGITVEKAMSPTEAMAISGLGWTVSKVSPVYAGGTSTEEYSAIIRDDTKKVLSIMSKDYQVAQNSELFDLAYSLGKDIKVESAFSMGNGKQLCVLCKTDTMDAQNNNDRVDLYMALFTSHDGTIAKSAFPTSIRAVCANTTAMILQDKRRSYRITHKGDMSAKHRQLADALQFYAKTGELFKEQVSAMSSKSLTREEIQAFWLDVWAMTEEPVVANPKTTKEYGNYLMATATIRKWSDLFDAERKTLNAPPSLWMVANACTNEIQHRVNIKGRVPTWQSKAYSNLQGKNWDASNKIMSLALSTL